MMDLLGDAGLVLVIRGLLWAGAPQLALRLALSAAQLPETRLGRIGAAAVAVGMAIVWLVRGSRGQPCVAGRRKLGEWP